MNKTGISYLDFTWNPVTGCTFGCPECWARGVAQTRLAPAMYSRGQEQRDDEGNLLNSGKALIKQSVAYRTFTPTLHPGRLDEPARRKKPAVIGVCFMGDLFDPASPAFHVLEAVLGAPQHTYIFLTKRPDRMVEVLGTFVAMKDAESVADRTIKPDNWYLGFSARNQSEFDAGWPHMAKLAAAGWKVWVSLEPMQGPIDLEVCPGCEKNCEQTICQTGPAIHSLSSVVVGAQSGKNRMPLYPDWVLSVQRQCAAAGIPFMFKQGNSTGKVVTLPELDGKRHTATAWTVEG